jgi:hypothetical protein
MLLTGGSVMTSSSRPPPNVFVRNARKLYHGMGFFKGYNFTLCKLLRLPNPIIILMISRSRNFCRSTFGLHPCSISVLELQWSLLQLRRSSAGRMLLVHSISQVQVRDYTSSEHYPA